MSSIFAHAVKWGYITTNPAVGADLPSLAGRHAKFLDEPDAKRLLELLQAEPIKWRAVITMDLLTGLRRGELLGLRWVDIDLDQQLLFVRQTWNYTPSKGCHIGTPKSRGSERPLRLSPLAVHILREYKTWQDNQCRLLGDAWIESDGRVFTAEDGQPMFPDSVTQWFRKFVQRCGLPDVHIHSLRHTYASLLLADGVPLVVVSRNLGHAQVSTTNNIYSHVIASAEARATAALNCFEDLIKPKNNQDKHQINTNEPPNADTP